MNSPYATSYSTIIHFLYLLILNGKSYIRLQLSFSTHPKYKYLWFLNFAVFTAPYTLHGQNYSHANSTKWDYY